MPRKPRSAAQQPATLHATAPTNPEIPPGIRPSFPILMIEANRHRDGLLAYASIPAGTDLELRQDAPDAFRVTETGKDDTSHANARAGFNDLIVRFRTNALAFLAQSQ